MTQSRKIAIIGAGLMGSGLARAFAKAHWTVAVNDPDAASRERLAASLSGVTVSDDLATSVQDAEIVIEAAPEIPALKQTLFAKLVRLTGPATLLGTNSSVIPVGVISEKLPDSEAHRVLGTHFWNPPDIIPLVEVIQGPRTSKAAIERAMQIMAGIGKEPVYVRRDVVPGNRLQHALWNEALALVDEGVCTPAEIDLIVKRSFGLRLQVLGPLENADLIGLDLTEQIHAVVLPQLRRALTPSPTLRSRLEAGKKGVKSGAGLYDGWTEEKTKSLRERLSSHLLGILGHR